MMGTHRARRTPAEMAHIIRTLTDAGLCSEVYYKELYLPASEINGAERPLCQCIGCSTTQILLYKSIRQLLHGITVSCM